MTKKIYVKPSLTKQQPLAAVTAATSSNPLLEPGKTKMNIERKPYAKPMLVKREKLSAVTAAPPPSGVPI